MGPSVGSRVDVLRQILKGMAHLHLLKIVHGNLKPTNILISVPSGAVGPMMKLTDFGLLHSYKSYSSLDNNNREFSAAFTESWSAPDSRLTIASDMFSYGLICGFSLSNGCHPFGEHDLEKIGRIKSHAPILLTADQLNHVDKSAAAQVLELIQALLSKEAEERPTAAQVLKHAFLASENLQIRISEQGKHIQQKLK